MRSKKQSAAAAAKAAVRYLLTQGPARPGRDQGLEALREAAVALAGSRDDGPALTILGRVLGDDDTGRRLAGLIAAQIRQVLLVVLNDARLAAVVRRLTTLAEEGGPISAEVVTAVVDREVSAERWREIRLFATSALADLDAAVRGEEPLLGPPPQRRSPEERLRMEADRQGALDFEGSSRGGRRGR